MLGTDRVALIVRGSVTVLNKAWNAYQPYISSTSSSWRPYTGNQPPFTPSSIFKLGADDLPRRAVSLVKDERRHQKFGDFDDHLEDVSIGGILDQVSDKLVLHGILTDWLRNGACFPVTL